MGEMRNLGCAVVACATAAVGIGVYGPWWKDEPKPLVAELPERLDTRTMAVVVGDPAARTTITVFEDPRCAMSREFETSGSGAHLVELAQQRKVTIEYRFATFIDDKQGGAGSKRAVAALGAALDAGKFTELHGLLYTNQPSPEAVDGFTDEKLLSLASKVPGLRSAAFDQAVRSANDNDFVTSADEAHARSGSPATPTILVNGQPLPVAMADAIYDKDDFAGIMRSYVG
ncbi:DsbA family protein [Streptomyces sp. NPDC047821]|uniref:DsbA family protein n=1 Tax=Streptomyces sp. NPDC047821 TaxID=3365488 RepID=UPI00371F4FA1